MEIHRYAIDTHGVLTYIHASNVRERSYMRMFACNMRAIYEKTEILVFMSLDRYQVSKKQET